MLPNHFFLKLISCFFGIFWIKKFPGVSYLALYLHTAFVFRFPAANQHIHATVAASIVGVRSFPFYCGDISPLSPFYTPPNLRRFESAAASR